MNTNMICDGKINKSALFGHSQNEFKKKNNNNQSSI